MRIQKASWGQGGCIYPHYTKSNCAKRKKPVGRKGLVAIPTGLLLVHATWIEAEILADFAKQNPLDWSEKPGFLTHSVKKGAINLQKK